MARPWDQVDDPPSAPVSGTHRSGDLAPPGTDAQGPGDEDPSSACRRRRSTCRRPCSSGPTSAAPSGRTSCRRWWTRVWRNWGGGGRGGLGGGGGGGGRPPNPRGRPPPAGGGGGG